MYIALKVFKTGIEQLCFVCNVAEQMDIIMRNKGVVALLHVVLTRPHLHSDFV